MDVSDSLVALHGAHDSSNHRRERNGADWWGRGGALKEKEFYNKTPSHNTGHWARDCGAHTGTNTGRISNTGKLGMGRGQSPHLAPCGTSKQGAWADAIWVGGAGATARHGEGVGRITHTGQREKKCLGRTTGSPTSNLEHLECSRQPHIQGRGAEKRTQRAG